MLINGFKNNQVIMAPKGSATPDKKVYNKAFLRLLVL